MPAIVILAAGRSTRFGASKQTTPVGPDGEWLLEYALADAADAGFDRAAVVVAPGSEATFVARLVRPDSRPIVHVRPQRTGLVEAAIEDAPRPVPWGTLHAVLAARDVAGVEPFAVVNADDYYGPESYRLAAAAVRHARDTGLATCVAMRLGDTLPPAGPVTRAVCRHEDGRVVALDETRGIERRDGRLVTADGGDLDAGTPVSMNCWVLPAAVLGELVHRFVAFTHEAGATGRECLLPAELSALVARGRLAIRLVMSPGPWFGLTAGADLGWVREALARRPALARHRPRKSTTARTRTGPNDSDSSL